MRLTSGPPQGARAGDHPRKRPRLRWLKIGLAAGLAVGLVLALSPPGRTAARAAVFLWQVTRLDAPLPLLARLTPAPDATAFLLAVGEGRNLEATLYQPGRAGGEPAAPGGGPAVLLYVPMAAPGTDRELTHSLAATLARLGFTVLVPFPEPERAAVADPADVDDVAAAFRYLRAAPAVDPGRAGIFAISYGAGPALIAAARDDLRDQVAFVVSLGGYADLREVIRFAVTGGFDYPGPGGPLAGRGVPDPYAREIFLRTLVRWVEDPADRRLLEEHGERAAARGSGAGVPAEGGSGAWWERLSPGGQVLARIIATRDPAEFDALYPLAPAPMRVKVDALSPARAASGLRTTVLIIHSTDDPFIPHTESLRLRDALGSGPRVHWAVVGSFRHAVPAELTPATLVRHYARDGWRLFRVAYHLVSQ